MDSLTSWLINKTLKSDYFKSWVLAQARHLVTVVGTSLIAKGLADHSMVEGALGLVTNIVSFYLAALDVKLVDGKIKVALNTTPPSAPVTPVEVKELPPVK